MLTKQQKAVAELLRLRLAFYKRLEMTQRWYGVYGVMQDFCVLFGDQNTRFDRACFREACGVRSH